MNLVNRISLSLGLAAAFVAAKAQDTVRYTGTTLSNVDYHHGQLSPAVGVHSVQVFRANRQHPELADGFSWTYNHAPMIAHWNNTFYLEYLSDPVGEHIPPSQSLLHTSKDGYNWSKPVVVFPPVKVPDGWKKEGYPGVAKNLYAVMHQRMGFFTSKKNRLLVLAYYGIAMDQKDDPNDGKGMGRAVREIKKDGSFGPIYFIRYNKSWDKTKSQFPFYTTSKDKGFVEACDELLATPLMMQQWVEEADRDDPLIPLKKEAKAFSYYHLPDGRVVGLWKNALTSISKDNGKTWEYNPTRAPKFVNSNAKIWGQRTSDGKFATVYNPSEFRWPLAISVSQDGLNYNNLLLVNGEISPMRYGGNYKSYGPQYVRGMEEGNGVPPDGKLWLTYSMNKEDIWVSSVPVPVTDKVTAYPNEIFNQMTAGKELDLWNTYSPKWAPVSISKMNDGTKALLLSDKDRYEYAKAERVLPSGKRLAAEITVIPQQNNKGQLDIEFLDSKGTPAIRLQFDSTANFTTKAGYRNRNVIQYKAGETYTIKIDLDTDKRFYNLDVNGKKMPGIFFAPVAEISRITFRTGDTRRFPDADTPTDPLHESLPKAGDAVENAAFFIKSLVTKGK